MVRGEPAGGWWRAGLPPLEPGAYTVAAQAVGVPQADRVSNQDVVSAVAVR
jgi:hypothetical protein